MLVALFIAQGYEGEELTWAHFWHSYLDTSTAREMDSTITQALEWFYDKEMTSSQNLSILEMTRLAQ